jgi:uncharacterized protein (TIGR00369 family)
VGIEHHRKKMLETHYERLERLYLSAPCNEYYDPGVRVSEGEAEIVIPVKERFHGMAGAVHASICFTAMADSAALAVNSIVEEALVVTVDFAITPVFPAVADELIARSRFMGMSGSHYLAESVLTDSEGKEIGRGSGTFMESDTALSSEIGYG